jgi:hypothetical protein
MIRATSTLLLLVSLGASPSSAEAPPYHAREITGQVVDAHSGKPIKSAVVAAMWLLSSTAPFAHEKYHQRLEIREVRTDSAGKFRIPAWGPRALPELSKIDETQPRLGVFKQGYRQHWIKGYDDISSARGTIRLVPFDGNAEARASSASAFLTLLARGSREALVVDWQNYPMTAVAVYRELDDLYRQGLKEGFVPNLPPRKYLTEEQRELLRRYE